MSKTCIFVHMTYKKFSGDQPPSEIPRPLWRPMVPAALQSGGARTAPETAKPIELRFGMVSRVDPRTRVIDGGPHWCHLANTIKRLCAAAMSGSVTRGGDAACFQITLANLVNRRLLLQDVPPVPQYIRPRTPPTVCLTSLPSKNSAAGPTATASSCARRHDHSTHHHAAADKLHLPSSSEPQQQQQQQPPPPVCTSRLSLLNANDGIAVIPRDSFPRSILARMLACRACRRRCHEDPHEETRPVEFKLIACSAYATSMTSVCLSVCITLADCDHVVQQKVEMSTWQRSWCLRNLHTEADLYRDIL